EIPPQSFGVVLSNTPAVLIIGTHIVLCLRVPLIRGLAIPCDCFSVVFGNAETAAIHKSKIGLRRGKALLCRLTEPRYRLHPISHGSATVLQTYTQVVLRGSVALVSRLAVPAHRL